MKKGKKAPLKRAILIVLLLFFGAEILVGAWHLHALLGEYAAGKEAYSALTQYVDLPQKSANLPSASPGTPQDTPNRPAVDFEALRAINGDIVAWIYIEGTNINYPIVQGQDNKYYLKHLFTGEKNRAGCVFLDCGNAPDFSDPNNVIYGHHLKSGIMFTELMGYKKQDFYDAHPTGWLLTPEASYKVYFFAGFVSNVQSGAWDLTFPSEEAFTRWLTKSKQKSAFSSEITPTPQDHILTLSTCTYEFSNARFVLMGVLEPRQ